MRMLLVILALLFAMPTYAQDAFELDRSELVEQDIETRARALGKTLRCVVCQNESIEESDAPLAADMRQLVRRELASGASEAEVTAMMRDRYGDYVLLKPPLQLNTLVLWFAPFIAALVGLFWFLSLRRFKPTEGPVALTDEERAKLDALRKS